MTTSQLKIEVTAEDRNATSVMRSVQGATSDLERGAGSLQSAFKALGGMIATYAGTQGLKSLITAYQDSARETAQARFFLAGHTKDLNSAMATMQKYGDEMQRTTGVSGEHATLVASKLVPRLKDLNKARSYATVLLKGERLGLLDATSTANMMMKATDGNEKAMRQLLEQYGVAVPAFASLDTVMAELNKRFDEGLTAMDPFSQQWNILSQQFGDMMENAGKPIVEFLATWVTKLNELIEKYPILGNIISGAMAVVFSLLAVAGAMMMGQFVMPVLSGMWTAGVAVAGFIASFGLLPIAIGVGIALVVAGLVWLYYNWDVVVAKLKALWAGMKNAWDMTIDWISDKMLAGVDILKNAWAGFKTFWIEVWNGIKQAVQDAWNYVSEKVNAIIDSVNRALQAMASIGGGMVGRAVGAVANFAGFRANGGQVSAGKTYMVGEQGAEFFTPRTDGYITPNSAIGGGVIININNPTILDETGARKLVDFTLDAFGRSHLFGT